jgi:hypothetical protein
MFSSNFLNSISQVLNPFKVISIVKDAINPTLGFIDYIVGYDTVMICYDDPPEQKDLANKILYFYIDDHNKLFCLKKGENPSEITEDHLGKEAYTSIVHTLSDSQKKAELDIQPKESLYQYLSLNNANLGLEAGLSKHVSAPYNRFETNFIASNPKIYKFYQNIKGKIDKISTFAASQTGIRIACVASSIAVAVASGGMIPAILAGAYSASIGVSVMLETATKFKLNRLSEEATLLEKYAASKIKQAELCKQKGIAFINNKFDKTPPKPLDNSITAHVIRSVTVSLKYIGTYFIETAVPILTTTISPLAIAASPLNLGIFIALAATSMGIGSYLNKCHADQKAALLSEIEIAKSKSFIPDYKNISELREHLRMQEQDLKKLDPNFVSTNEQLLQKKTLVQEMGTALKDVVNPYGDYQTVKDPKSFAKAIATSVGVITTAATLGTGIGGVGYMATELASISLITGTVAATASVSTCRRRSSYIHKKDYVFTRDRETALERPALSRNVVPITPERKTSRAEEYRRTHPKKARVAGEKHSASFRQTLTDERKAHNSTEHGA